MAIKAKKSAPKKSVAKKVAKKAPKKVTAKKAPVVAHVDFKDLDRKGLAARARQLKVELMAMRFNMQSPSLSEYRKKKKELGLVLRHLS